MNRKLIGFAVALAIGAGAAWAQMGPGMMGGYGPQGMGPGMTGGYGGFGMGPGMMGPGMMGPGMMGPGMMGPGMMSGYGNFGGLDLTDEQRTKIAGIQQEVSRKQWDLMAKMHEQSYRMHELDATGTEDDAAARKAFDDMNAAHRQMFETMLDARKRIRAALTQEQRDKLLRGWRGR